MAARKPKTSGLSIGDRSASSENQEAKSASTSQEETKSAQEHPQTKQKKTMAQLDEEMRQAMEGTAGDGGEAGLELEDGKPVSMKRGVKDNMFRYI